MKRHLLITLVLFLCASKTHGQLIGSPADIKAASDWIMSLQYTDDTLPSYGAIRIHHNPGFVGSDGNYYYRVVPYSSSLGVAGLLRAPVPGRLQVAEMWMDWYFRHMAMNGTPPGVVYDHWYRGDGNGETACPPGIASDLCYHDDASDSYAAALLGVAWTYYDEGGDAAFLAANKGNLETIAEVILALQQADGLTWAKDGYRVKYLMDNSEVYWGLKSMARLERIIRPGIRNCIDLSPFRGNH